MRKINNLDYTSVESVVSKINDNIDKVHSFKTQLQKLIDEKVAEFKIDGMSMEELSESHNNLLLSAKCIADKITDSIDSYAQDRTDKWHDSENGMASEEWLSQWQSFAESLDFDVHFDEVDIIFNTPDLENFEIPPQERKNA